jgi:hypoxanthine-DNA glycosylase
MDVGIKHGLPPVARSDARLFILGSLPGDASLAASEYYAHPRNAFWRLVEAALDENLQPLAYAERLERLMERRIGLWDVVASARRTGSLDQAIRDAGHNPLADYLAGFPQLEAVAFNGMTASTIGRRLLGASPRLKLIDLPSSSPANTRPFAEKEAQWAAIRRFCGQ